MKSFGYLSLLFLMFLSGCNDENTVATENHLDGRWEGRTFINDYFGLKLTLSPEWKVNKAKSNTSHNLKFIRANYVISDNDINQPSVTFRLECEKIQGSENVNSKLGRYNNYLSNLLSDPESDLYYNQETLEIDNFVSIQLGKHNYIFSRFSFFEHPDGFHFVDRYMTSYKGYFITFHFEYRNNLYQDICEEILNQLK